MDAEIVRARADPNAPRRRTRAQQPLRVVQRVLDDVSSDGSDSGGDVSVVGDRSSIISRVHAGIRSIEELRRSSASCERVEQINLFGNRIASLDGLQRFSRLQELCLSNNQIEEFSFHELDPLKQLRVLDLSANRLSSLRGLPLLPRLEELSLAHNRLVGLEGLLRPAKLPRLRYLDLRGNQIASPATLVALQHLKRLNHLRLQSRDGAVSNPICSEEEYPDAMLEILPALKKLDEEDTGFLREVSRMRMPKYHSAARRIQSNPSRGIDGSSQTTPGKPSHPGRQDVRIFAQSEERVGYEISQIGTTQYTPPSRPTSADPAHRARPAVYSTASTKESAPKARVQEVPLSRLVLREASTNTELDFEKAILERENRILETQAAALARDQDNLRKETEFFAKEKEQKESIRHLQGQLASSLERTATLEAQLAESNLKWERKLGELESSKSEDEQLAVARQAQLQQLCGQIESLQNTNESLSATLKAKSDEIDRLKTEASLLQSVESLSLRDTSARLAAVEATLKEAEQRHHESDLLAKSKQAALEAQVEKLKAQLTGESEHLSDQQKEHHQLEYQLQAMKASRDQYRDECLHKDDEIYRLKKSLLQKSEEVEEHRALLTRAAERQDRMQHQQQQLYEKQLQASVMQLEMEFRREHQQATEKLQTAHRKYQEAVRQHLRLKGSYESSLKREGLLRDEVQRLSAIIEGDKEKLVDQELAKRAEYEVRIQRLEDDKQALQGELRLLNDNLAQASALPARVAKKQQECDDLTEKIQQLQDEITKHESKEGDLKAAIKVKDVMLDDQLRQLEELRTQNRKLEEEYRLDTSDLHSQMEDLENALDDSIQQVERLQDEYDCVKDEVAAKEEESAKHSEKLDDWAKQVELKNAALELIEGEMDRMRETLSKQDDLFQKRLERHLEVHRDELAKLQLSREQAEAKLREEMEAQQAEWMQKYNAVADDLKEMAAQNTKLRVALDQERKLNVASDREMRVLLAQLDRERHVKNERLGDIKRLFEQLQQESP